MGSRVVTVFGATGFLGRRIVRHLHARGCVVRIASRHADQGRALFGTDDPRLRPIGADIRDRQSVADALADAHAAVNAISLYTERGTETFHAVHVECAERVAAEAQRIGIEQLVHVSGIGADPASGSPYVRSRGQGELAVRAASRMRRTASLLLQRAQSIQCVKLAGLLIVDQQHDAHDARMLLVLPTDHRGGTVPIEL